MGQEREKERRGLKIPNIYGNFTLEPIIPMWVRASWQEPFVNAGIRELESQESVVLNPEMSWLEGKQIVGVLVWRSTGLYLLETANS